jgi:sugar lactone lactonase YvrE
VDATTGIITTAAGGGTVNSTTCSGAASTLILSYTQATTIDTAGNVYFIDSNRVCKIDVAGNSTLVAGSTSSGFSGDNGAATSARLNSPQSLALDSLGNLYIADSVNHRIRKVDATTGIITTVAGNGTNADSGDGGAAVDASFRFPGGIAIDTSDLLYIADSNANRIRRVDGDGIITTVAGTGVAGFSGDAGPATSATLNGPSSITIDEVGNLFIADVNNERVRMVNTSGNIVTIAGDGNWGFAGDNGPVTAAQLHSPQGVAVDNLGNLYIADTSNQRIRKVELPDVYPPMITLLGDSPAAVALDASYVDPGSTVVDDTDSDIVVDVTGTVDTATPGAYTLSYSSTDSAGNVGHATRMVYVADQTPPVIALLGDDPMQVSHGSVFVDPGTTVSDNFESGLTTHVSGSVNTSAVGEYVLTYDVSDSSGNAALSVTCTVQVVDTTAPSIVLNGDMYPEVEAGSIYVDAGVSPSDNVDPSPTLTVTGTVDTTTPGSYTLDYYTTDSSGNVSVTLHRYVEVIDTTAPVITLLGDNPMTITPGNSFVDPGATVSDNVDSGLVATVSGSVDSGSVGDYLLTYTVSDSAGNAATTVTRTVTVVAATSLAVTAGGGSADPFWLLLLLPALRRLGVGRRQRG